MKNFEASRKELSFVPRISASYFDALPMLVYVPPTCEEEIPDYSPTLMLDSSCFDAGIVHHSKFAYGCQVGFRLVILVLCTWMKLQNSDLLRMRCILLMTS